METNVQYLFSLMARGTSQPPRTIIITTSSVANRNPAGTYRERHSVGSCEFPKGDESGEN